jgi:hypothetical protein
MTTPAKRTSGYDVHTSCPSGWNGQRDMETSLATGTTLAGVRREAVDMVRSHALWAREPIEGEWREALAAARKVGVGGIVHMPDGSHISVKVAL